MKTINNFKGNVKNSLVQLTTTGQTRTGQSGYSKGWAHKSVWTSEVIAACKELGIEIESGNDAMRGGANGEFIRLVSDKRKNRKIWESMKIAKSIAAEQKADQLYLESKVNNWLEANKGKIVKPEGFSWSEAIAQKMAIDGIYHCHLGYNQMKSILFAK